jgi:hypothetical protein
MTSFKFWNIGDGCVGHWVDQPAIILRKHWAKVSCVHIFHVQKYSRTWEQLWSTTVLLCHTRVTVVMSLHFCCQCNFCRR